MLLLPLVVVAAAALLLPSATSFAPPATTLSSSLRAINSRSRRIPPTCSSSNVNDNGEDDGMLADEIPTTINNNWMKRSTSIDFNPAELSGSNNANDDQSIYMDLGINGVTFGTADLSRRMHEAMMKVAAAKFPQGIPQELSDVYLLYSMDATAKEAVKVAMDSNGYALNLGSDEAMQDEGAWGQISEVSLLDGTTGEPTRGEDGRETYGGFAEAISRGGWEPGEGYSFVVREVPSRRKAMDLEALLKALDPDGTLWEEAREKGIVMPGDEIDTLRKLGEDCEQRVKAAPMEATDDSSVFRGGESKGYNVIKRSALLKGAREEGGSENQKTLLHVMDSLANHGCLIVDLTDGDTNTDGAIAMSKMWDATSDFFQQIADDAEKVPPMQQADGTGSSHAVVGFASFKDGDNQFLETRLRRSDGALLPEETTSLIGEDGARGVVDAFRVMSDVGKDVVRIVTAASSVEARAFVSAAVGDADSGSSGLVVEQEGGGASIAGLSFEDASVSGIVEDDRANPNGGGDREPTEEDLQRAEVLASDAAILLTEEIMDDGRPIVGSGIEHDEGPVSMSPHRMCKYSNNNGDKKKGKKDKPSEIFGAHTDTSFVTIVPAAQVSGLEVFDEDALQWYRPELNARKHAKGLDPKSKMDDQFPWHCRYLIVMPGELLQITSRNNIPAAVHRVVAAVDKPRLSAPVLLRARPGTTMDVERYMGSLEEADGLLVESNGMRMEDLHDSLQPGSKQ